MRVHFFYLFLFLTFSSFTLFSQAYFRISADFSIKDKNPKGSEFYKGKVFFDKEVNKVVYNISFPDKKMLVMADTQMYQLVNKKVVSQQFVPSTNKFTVFNLALSGDLRNFGLQKTGYAINTIEENGDQTIIEWLPPSYLEDKMGKVVLSLKEGQLFGIALFNPEGELTAKKFYQEYKSIKGLPFPSKVIQISYIDGAEYYKMTTFSNVKIDELESDEMYNVDLSN
ncbi:hypothetical protein [Marivirga arenosa]|uniref:Uncharacterized protein n=1 Tax=Marivirga arenosa TaxID=3059076 RepID=A0AA51ZVN7_9BACT|nr:MULTISPECIES: hypothetical protein [unclassified Marivirga]WMN06059.1 hypothetical protein QYS48_31455 [Marivirga sp. ABR2-2]WNB17599.1 hypothetical protein QYS47_34420 [Marivirga sp. BKB1-2]